MSDLLKKRQIRRQDYPRLVDVPGSSGVFMVPAGTWKFQAGWWLKQDLVTRKWKRIARADA